HGGGQPDSKHDPITEGPPRVEGDNGEEGRGGSEADEQEEEDVTDTTSSPPAAKRRRSSLPSVRRHGNRWGTSVRVNDPSTGKSRFVWVSGKTEREAKQAVADIVSKRASGTYAEPSKQTFKAFLGEW